MPGIISAQLPAMAEGALLACTSSVAVTEPLKGKGLQAMAELLLCTDASLAGTLFFNTPCVEVGLVYLHMQKA